MWKRRAFPFRALARCTRGSTAGISWGTRCRNGLTSIGVSACTQKSTRTGAASGGACGSPLGWLVLDPGKKLFVCCSQCQLGGGSGRLSSPVGACGGPWGPVDQRIRPARDGVPREHADAGGGGGIVWYSFLFSFLLVRDKGSCLSFLSLFFLFSKSMLTPVVRERGVPVNGSCDFPFSFPLFH